MIHISSTFIATGIGSLPQILVSGGVNGCIYALVALSLSIVYNVTGVINFAVGDFVMAGAMLTILFAGASGHPARLPLGFAVILAIVAVGLAGLVVERLVIHPRRKQGTIFLLILTIGLSSLFEGIALIPTRSETFAVRPFIGGPNVKIGDVTFSRQDVWIVAVALILVGMTWFGLTHTTAGKAMRACQVNPIAARLVGIKVDRYWTYAFVLGALVAGIAGAVIVPVTYASYNMGIQLSLNGFVAWILGGAESPGGALLGGLGYGIIAGVILAYAPATVANYGDAVPLLLLVVLLIFRKSGLSKEVAVQRV
jgi:branched-chain amino acid transport system permease protein